MRILIVLVLAYLIQTTPFYKFKNEIKFLQTLPKYVESDYDQSSIKELGQGGFGTTETIKKLSDSQEYVIKEFSSEKAMITETLILAYLQHVAFVPKLISILQWNKLVQEYFYDGSLTFFLDDNIWRINDYEQIRILAFQIVVALDSIHREGVIHMDVKLDNIVKSGRRIAFIDFNLANFEDDIRKNNHGTPWSMAPEVYDGGVPTLASDIYSLGITIIDLYAAVENHSTSYGHPGFLQVNEDEQDSEKRYEKNLYKLTESFARKEELEHLLEQMVEIDPTKRPTTQEIMDHEYFRDLANDADLMEFILDNKNDGRCLTNLDCEDADSCINHRCDLI